MDGARFLEKIVNLHIERLSEGVYLATSEDVQGLVAQGRTIAETIEIARDLAEKLIEARQQVPAIGLRIDASQPNIAYDRTDRRHS